MSEEQSFLFEIWPYVEKVGIPILVSAGAITLFSVNFYWWAHGELRRFQKHLKKHQSPVGYESDYLLGGHILDVIAGFLPISKFDKELWNYSYARQQRETIISLRKFYRIAFPVIIVLGTVGILINEMVIDK